MANPADRAALTAQVSSITSGWQIALAGGWNSAAAGALYGELEPLMAELEGVGDGVLGDALSELTVYLSAFVESSRVPTPAQLALMSGLVERVREAAGVPVERAPASTALPSLPGKRARIAFYVCDPAKEIAGLATQLGQSGYAVRPLASVEAAVREFGASPAHVVLLDEQWLPSLGEMLRTLDRARGDLGALPLMLIVGSKLDPAQTAFALRGGADAIVEARDPMQVVNRIDELLARRRELAFRVLVVDDDRQQALFCETVLKHRGFSVQVCTDSLQVEEKIAAFRPDLVLLDLYMPDRNGIEVARRIRQHAEWALLPVVFISGETDMEKRFDAIRMGGDDFVVKPVKPRHLIDLVDSRIRHARQAGESRPEPRREERRGVLVGRSVLIEEVERARQEGTDVVAMIYLEPAALEKLRTEAGFVGTGLLSQQIGAALGGENEVVRPIAAAGDLAFVGLARAESEGVLRQRMQNLHKRLESRQWGRADDAFQVDFVLTALRVAPGGGPADATVAAARAMAHKIDASSRVAFELGSGAASQETEPRRRVLTTLLRGELPPAAIRCEYQPLIPVAGKLKQQYLVRQIVQAPKARPAIEVGREVWLSLARELERVAAVERQLLRAAFRQMREAGGDLRLHLPVAIESVLDPAFAPWLLAEIQSQGINFGSLAIAVDCAEASANAGAVIVGIEAIQVAGARVTLVGVDGEGNSARLARHRSVDTVLVSAPAAGGPGWSAARGKLITDLRMLGKRVVCQDVSDAGEITDLLKLQADYFLAESFGPWSAQPDFAFDFDLGQTEHD